VSWYLTITPSHGQPNADTRLLVEFLSGLPELRQNGSVAFEGAPGQPWVDVILAKNGPSDGYSSDGSFIPFIDIVELVCSDSEDEIWYERLAGRIAAFLGWPAIEEHGGRQVWPIPV
jgi:hypothetical protein